MNRSINKLEWAYCLVLAALYLVSKYAQATRYGPDWFRWYASDFGFVGFMSLVTLASLGSSRIGAVWGFGLGVFYELGQMLSPTYNEGPWDILVMAVAMCLVLLASRRQEVLKPGKFLS